MTEEDDIEKTKKRKKRKKEKRNKCGSSILKD